jgi:hypothetical protein
MKTRALLIGLGCAVFLFASTQTAHAQTPSVAQGLFEEATTLMSAGNYAEACPKLAESHRLDPGGGTIFNLAICLEKEGKTASAYVAYDEALARAVKDVNRERETAARARLAHLKPLLSKLVVQVSPKASSLADLDVRFDGSKLRPEAWGIRVPVDPGPHTLTASASNHVDFRRDVQIDEPGKVYELDVPELTAADAAPPIATATAPIAAPPAEPLKKSDEVGGGGQPRRSTLGYVLLAAGGAFVVGGGVSGVLAITNHATSNDECPNGPTSCTRAGVRAEEAATRFSWGANIGIGVGLIAVGVGTYLLLATPTSTSTPSRAARMLERPLVITF